MQVSEALRKLAEGIRKNLIDPIIGAGWGLLATFFHVDFEPFSIAPVLPIRNSVAHVVKKRPSAEIQPPDQHATEVTEVTNIIAAQS